MNIDTTNESRRRAIVRIPEQFIMDVIRGLKVGYQTSAAAIPDIPETARVVGVWYDFSRSNFAAVLDDPSFASVPDGIPYPEIELSWSLVTTRKPIAP